MTEAGKRPPQVVQATVWQENKPLPYAKPTSPREQQVVWRVEAPCLSFHLGVLAHTAHTVEQIIATCLAYRQLLARKKRKGVLGLSTLPLDQAQYFSLSVRGKKGPQRLTRTAVLTQSISPEKTLWLHPEQLEYQVAVDTGTGAPHTLRLQVAWVSTVQDLMKQICASSSLKQGQDYRLYYTNASGNALMQPDRHLLFYRLHQADALLFRLPPRSSAIEALLQGTTDILLEVRCPDLGIVKKMRVQNDVSFAEILTRFGEKNAIDELGQYEVVLQGQEKACNPLYKLTDFVKENSVSLIIRKSAMAALMSKAMASANSAPSSGEGPFGEFLGTGRSATGLVVPQILLDFERFLEQEKAWGLQGLFRLAGSGLKVEGILAEMNASQYQFGGDTAPWGVHEITSLIKKWFLLMPERLFETVIDVQLRKCAESEPQRIFSLLPRPKQDLLSWLVQLLARVALEPTSKMDPFNLGLVLAPCIACKDDVPLAAQVSATKYAATIVEKHILASMEVPARPAEFQAGQLKKKRKKKKKSGKSSPLLGMQRAGTMRVSLSKSESPASLERKAPASTLPTPLLPPSEPSPRPLGIQRRSQSVHDITVTPCDPLDDDGIGLPVLSPVTRKLTGPGTPRLSKVSLSAQGISKSRSNTPESSPRGSQESSPRNSFLSPRMRTMSTSRTQT